MLRAVGELLPKSFRGEDIVGWWGGAEFMVGMYGSPKEQSAIKLTQICNKIAEQSFLADDGRPVRVTCTGGVAQYQVDGDTVSALRHKAGEILQQVREIGINRVGIAGVQQAGPMTRRVDVVDRRRRPHVGGVAAARNGNPEHERRDICRWRTRSGGLTGNVPEVRGSIILLDVDLPTLNGLEVLRRLKSVEVTRVSSVIMLTGRAGERNVLTALELGAVDHITKPFSVPVLMHKVRTILKQSQ